MLLRMACVDPNGAGVTDDVVRMAYAHPNGAGVTDVFDDSDEEIVGIKVDGVQFRTFVKRSEEDRPDEDSIEAETSFEQPQPGEASSSTSFSRGVAQRCPPTTPSNLSASKRWRQRKKAIDGTSTVNKAAHDRQKARRTRLVEAALADEDL